MEDSWCDDEWRVRGEITLRFERSAAELKMSEGDLGIATSYRERSQSKYAMVGTRQRSFSETWRLRHQPDESEPIRGAL